jgi:hypothetical protein
MYPEGTEVTYKQHRGVVKFCDPESGCCTICIRTFPNERVRDVCLVVHRADLKHVIPVIGNHNRSDDY